LSIQRPILETNKLSIKPTYNISQGAIIDFVPLQVQANMRSFNYPDTTVLTATETLNGITSYQTTNGTNRLYSNIDTISGFDFGEDTQMDFIQFIKPFSSFEITQCFINAGFTMEVSARSAGTYTFTSIDLDVLLFDSTGITSRRTIFNTRFETGHAGLAATGTETYIVQAQFGDVSIRPSDKIGFRFRSNVTEGTGDYHMLMLPFYYWSPTSGNKIGYESGITTHALPDFDNAAPAIKNQIRSYPIDTFGAPQL